MVVCVVGGEWWVMGGRWWVVMVMMVVGSGANAELIASELLPVGRRIYIYIYIHICIAFASFWVPGSPPRSPPYIYIYIYSFSDMCKVTSY